MFFNHLGNDFHLWNTHHNVLLNGPQGSNAVDTQVHPLVKTDVSAITVVNSVVFRLIPAILRSHWPCTWGSSSRVSVKFTASYGHHRDTSFCLRVQRPIGW